MNIPNNLHKRLKALNENRDDYQYKGSQSLREKTLTRLVAPTAVGKSTIINRLLEIASQEGVDAAEVGTITTRPGRPSDPPNYKTADDGVTHEMMIDQIENGELVSWSLFETGHLYATSYDSYPATYNFLPCLPDSMPMQERAGFDAIVEADFLDTFRIFHNDGSHYTWWTHWANARARNVGWRIDYILASSSLKKQITAASIHADQMGSDHCPVSIKVS